MFKKMALMFGSKSKAQEIILLLKDAKPVVRQGFYDSELPKVEQFCQEKGLFLTKSRFKVILADEGDYSNKGLRIPETDQRPGMHFVYISKDEETTWLAAYHEMMRNDRALGLVLGYPLCCVEFFCRNFNKNNTNPQQRPTNPYTNLTKREKDDVIISHFPCSSDCAHSIVLGKNYLKAISEFDKARGKELMESLKV